MLCPHCQSKMPEAPGRAGQSVSCPACGKRVTVSGAVFDPYYTWLGIPPPEQPPNFYRLLGLQLFENNPQVIQNAADRQMRHLQSIQAGAHAAHSQRLLNEIALARTCLLNPTNKAVYDQQLTATLATQHLGRPIGSPVPIAPPPPPSAPNAPAVPSISLKTKPPETQPSKPAPRPKKQNSLATTIGIMLGGLMGLAMGAMVVFYFTGMDVLGWSAKERIQAERKATPEIAKPDPIVPSKKAPPKQPSTPQRQQPDTLPPEPAQPSELPKPTPLPAVPAPQPPQPSSPLANIPSATTLPPLGSSSSAALFALALDPTEPLTLAIYSDTANIPVPALLAAKPQSENDVWHVNYADDLESAAKDAIATIRREGRNIAFAWTTAKHDPQAQRQLANCLLEVHHGNESRLIQLRDIAKVEPIKLNLDKDKQSIAIDVADLPATGKILLKVQELVDFSRGAKIRGANRPLAVGRSSFVEFSNMPGAQFELRFVGPSPRGLMIALDGVFEEKGNREFDLSFPSLKKFNDSLESIFAKTQSELGTIDSNLTTAKANLGRMKASSTYAPPQVAAANSLVQNLSARQAALKETMDRLHPRMAAVPTVRAFMEELHERSKIKFTICATARDKEIVLAESE